MNYSDLFFSCVHCIDCSFLLTFPFYLNFQTYWHKVVHNIFLYVCSFNKSFPSIINIHNVCLFSLSLSCQWFINFISLFSKKLCAYQYFLYYSSFLFYWLLALISFCLLSFTLIFFFFFFLFFTWNGCTRDILGLTSHALDLPGLYLAGLIGKSYLPRPPHPPPAHTHTHTLGLVHSQSRKGIAVKESDLTCCLFAFLARVPLFRSVFICGLPQAPLPRPSYSRQEGENLKIPFSTLTQYSVLTRPSPCPHSSSPKSRICKSSRAFCLRLLWQWDNLQICADLPNPQPACHSLWGNGPGQSRVFYDLASC